MLKYKLYINDILKSIERIEKSTKNLSKENFKRKSEIWDATLMRLHIIGESMKNIPSEIKKKHSQVEWKEITRFRNLISHAYFSINVEVVWEILKVTLPKLKKDIQRIRGGLD